MCQLTSPILNQSTGRGPQTGILLPWLFPTCRTSEAVGVEQSRGVGEASAVGVAVDGAYAGLVSTTVLPGNVDGVADAAVGQPAGVTLVEAGLPGQVELAHGGQLGSQRVAVCGGRG